MSKAWTKFFFWSYLIFMVWAAATVTNPADPDLWHRLALGEALWATGHFPPGDAFSYLADYQQIADHEWGSALIFYGLWQWGGGTAMVVTKLVTLLVTLVLVVWAGLQSRAPGMLLAAFYALVLLALLPSFQSTVRCMTFTHIFFALFLYWFQRERHGHPVPSFVYVLAMILWANLHGGFVVGLAWLGVVAVVEIWQGGDWKKWGLRLGLCTFATLINPFGVQLWISTVRALLITRQGFGEWAPVSWWTEVGSYPGYKILLIGVVVSLAWQILRRGWKEIDQLAVAAVVVFIFLSMTSARHTSLFAVVAGALIPGLFQQEVPLTTIRGPLRRLGKMGFRSVLVVVPLYSALIVLPGEGLQLGHPAISCPVEAVGFLQRHNIHGRLLVPFNYGSYALWELRGQMRVSMDGRYDLVYRAETYRRVDDFFLARGDWKSLLSAPAPDAILVPRNNAVFRKLRGEPHWEEVFYDDTDALFLPR